MPFIGLSIAPSHFTQFFVLNFKLWLSANIPRFQICTVLCPKSKSSRDVVYFIYLKKRLQKVGPELQKVLTFRIANVPDYRRVALQTFRIAIGLSSFFKTFWVALSPCYPGVFDSARVE